MDIRAILRTIVNRLWIIVLGCILVPMIGLILLSSMGLLSAYEATATVSIGGDLSTIERNPQGFSLGEDVLQIYADLATRFTVMQAVIADLRLTSNASQLAQQVTVSNIPNTQYLEISVRNRDPRIAAAIANAIGNQLIQITPVQMRQFITFIEEAVVPTRPLVSPGMMFTLLVVLGILVSGGFIFLTEFLRDPVYSAKEVTRRTGLPVLMTARPSPHWWDVLSKQKQPWRKADQSLWWPLMQECRRHVENNGARSPFVLVTSPKEGDHKAIVAANLAIAWSRTVRCAILIDMDLKSPTMHRWFGLPLQPGLMELLRSEMTDKQIQKVLQATSTPSLSVLTLGNGLKNKPIDFTPVKLAYLLNEIAKQADVIILNGPPLLDGQEGAIVASQADGVLLAVGVGQTRMIEAQDASSALKMMDVDHWGTILTEVN